MKKYLVKNIPNNIEIIIQFENIKEFITKFIEYFALDEEEDLIICINDDFEFYDLGSSEII